jgi:predicted TIM-barrel fold metal-dependent hydrolase
MQIDMHTHVLALAVDPEFTVKYGREGSLCIYRSAGSVPTHRMPTEQEWEESGFSRKGWPVIGARETVRDHEGFDKTVILSVSPQWLDGRLIGTVDPSGVTGVEGPPHPDKCNDYIASLVSQEPHRLIGFASVNPAYQGPEAAVEELTRAVKELGLSGVKLYPMYQHWSPDNPELAFPVYQCALELGIPVMFHQAGSTRIDASLALGRPALLDDVGREFRDLTVIIAHMGIPWQDEALFLLTKHPNFYGELSYLIAALSPRELFGFLHKAEPYFVPLEKFFFGSDYPGFLYDPVVLRNKLLTINEYAEPLDLDPIPDHKLQAIMGDNAAAVLGWSETSRLRAV